MKTLLALLCLFVSSSVWAGSVSLIDAVMHGDLLMCRDSDGVPYFIDDSYIAMDFKNNTIQLRDQGGTMHTFTPESANQCQDLGPTKNPQKS